MEPIVIWKAKQYSGDRLKVIVLCTRDVLCTDFSRKNPVTSAQFFMQNVCDQTGSIVDLGVIRKRSPSRSSHLMIMRSSG